MVMAKRVTGLFEVLQPRSGGRTRSVASFLFLFHIVEHFLQIKIFVVAEMLVTNGNHKWHAGKLDNVRLITRWKEIATRIRNNVPLHAARPFWRAKAPDAVGRLGLNQLPLPSGSTKRCSTTLLYLLRLMRHSTEGANLQQTRNQN